MIVSELTEQDRARWDAYVSASPEGLPFHLSGWKQVLSKTYRYDTHFLMAREGDRVRGVVPFFAVRSPLTGKQLMTPPGGMLADSDEAAAALLEEAGRVARESKLDQVTLHDARRAWPGNLQTSNHHVAWIIDICPDLDTLWKKVDRNVRRQVRKGREQDFRVEFDHTGRLAADFYTVMSRFTHEVGTPVFGQDFIENVIEAFPGQFYITAVYRDQQVLGAYFSMEIGTTNFGLWGSTIREYLPLHVSYVAYWNMLEYGAKMGYETMDMGRSPAGSGASQFKSQWGAYSIPIYQQVLPASRDVKAEAIAARVRTDGRIKTFTQVWSRLPLPLTQFLGPRLRRHVPFA